MQDLNSVVLNVLKNMTLNKQLFTILDVSNEVRKTLPDTKHYQVREIVKQNIDSVFIEGYSSTEIVVHLKGGTTANAILYHPLEDSWDLDSKYDSQKRSQSLQDHPVNNVVVPKTWADIFNSSDSLFPRK